MLNVIFQFLPDVTDVADKGPGPHQIPQEENETDYNAPPK